MLTNCVATITESQTRRKMAQRPKFFGKCVTSREPVRKLPYSISDQLPPEVPLGSTNLYIYKNKPIPHPYSETKCFPLVLELPSHSSRTRHPKRDFSIHWLYRFHSLSSTRPFVLQYKALSRGPKNVLSVLLLFSPCPFSLCVSFHSLCFASSLHARPIS